MTQQKWYDKPIIESYVRPALEKIGGPKTFGATTAAVSLPAWYLITKMLGHDFSHWRPLTAAAITGAGGWYATRSSTPLAVQKDKDLSRKAWADSLLPRASKEGSDIISAPIPAHNLFRAVHEAPGLNDLQRGFLFHGINNATASDKRAIATLEDLANGFESSVNEATSGRLGYVTRAVEGALIGAAFSGLVGMSPAHRKWATGVSSLTDALYGNKFVSTLGQLQPYE